MAVMLFISWHSAQPSQVHSGGTGPIWTAGGVYVNLSDWERALFSYAIWGKASAPLVSTTRRSRE